MKETPDVSTYVERERPNYEILATQHMRDAILRRSGELVNLIVDQGYDNIVFLDRSSRPAVWALHAAWQLHVPERTIPSLHHLNTGQKKFREKYMYGVGDAIGQDGHGNRIRQFVGMFDSEENIALFLQRVSADTVTKSQIERDLGEERKQALLGGRILIVDDVEFEGVQRLFAIQVLADIYKPREISYFEWGESLPPDVHGLSYQESESYTACLTDDQDALTRAKKAREELRRLILRQHTS